MLITPFIDTSELEDQLKSSRDEIAELRSLLSSQEDKIFLLEHEIECLLKEIERCNRTKDDMIRSLQHQLEEKSTTIAHLATKLHHTQKYLQKALEAQQNVKKPSMLPSSLVPHPKEPLVPLPKEPPTSPSYRTGRITRRLRCSVTSNMVPPPTDELAHFPTAKNQVMFQGDTALRSNDTVKSRGDTVLHSKAPILPPIGSHETRPSHKRFVLAKSQGLASAPCSTRLVDYSRPPQEISKTEDEESGQGRLLVKYESHLPLPELHQHRVE